MAGELNVSAPPINFTEAFQCATGMVTMDSKDIQTTLETAGPSNTANPPTVNVNAKPSSINTGSQNIAERAEIAIENNAMMRPAYSSLLTETMDAASTLQMDLGQGHQAPQPANTNSTQSVEQSPEVLAQQQAMENTKYTREAQLNIDTPNGPSMGGMAA